MKTRTDRLLLVLTALSVGGLAVVAGAISFAHMRELALDHDQLGWKSYAFPVSVDGLEIVASLYLVAQRRAGRATGWIPWIALIVGTAASLAANVAVGGPDLIGKALAGWPALSMLVSVKLLFSMVDHTEARQRVTVPDDQRTSSTVPDVPGTDRRTGRDESRTSRSVLSQRRDGRGPSATGAAEPAVAAPRGVAGALGDVRTVAHLVPAARAARSALARAGRSLSRDNLANAMRDDGQGVSNARASLLLKTLKAEVDVPAIVPAFRRPHTDKLEPLSGPVA
jgi:hypothetical protein